MPDVAMPRLSDSMEEGTILKWLKSDGDEVQRGDELVEIETDKANMTYEADQAGVLSIVAKEGDTLPVGDTIARIGEAGEEAPSGGGEAEEPAGEEGGGEEPQAQAAEPAQETATEDAEEAGEREAPEETEEAATANGKPAERPEPAPAPAGESGEGDGDGRVKASPVARRMARELGLELAALEGTGPGGRIVKADVEAAARGDGQAAEAEGEAPAAAESAPADAAAPADAEAAPAEAAPAEKAPAEEAPAPAAEKAEVPPPVVADEGQTGRGEVTHEDLSRLQQTVARRMAESKATAPEFILHTEVDMEEAVELRKQLKAAAGDAPAPSYNDFVVKAAALALTEFPRANGAYRDGKFELYSRVNVGVAVAGQDALIVPTILDADRKSLGTIARESRAVAERARAGAITPPELAAGTFTVSNLGMFQIKSFTAVINPPQAAILAVGSLDQVPVVRDGEVVVRHVMALTLTCDHRILYGADAAQFLSRIRERLENPLSLAL
jgi:pyruvate dehydrogenase E2 component (dihydrolipoamide acetyltransferase)